ncbi:three-Cys-motif partner protein TcmP [Nocardia sp. NPDC127526]|uniref:three-Cys-motif partner protein TcmP n=1 Tax=Nocardia sp. NPDC127526 TaxID=3345393 RepID=UPI00363E66A9
MAREWSYWTSNKLNILGDYVPAFNTASKRSSERLYLDLMAGRPENVERLSGSVIDGSPRRVLSANPGFTRHVFFELPANADKLEVVLRKEFPQADFRVVRGDCNRTIGAVLADLRPLNWAPTFVFIDQQAAEVEWETLVRLSKFKDPRSKTKPELWLLVSPASLARGVGGQESKTRAFREKISRFYGTWNWLNIQDARDARIITVPEYQDEMVNLIRFRLTEHLGYLHTERIPMRMTNGHAIYDMVFASDHDVGAKIMRDLYRQAAEREPRMIDEARRLAITKREEELGKLSLIALSELPATEPLPVMDPEGKREVLWRSTPHWRPSSRKWWNDRHRPPTDHDSGSGD